MTKKKPKPLSSAFLKSKGVPAVLIAGLITASVLVWNGWQAFSKSQNYYQLKSLFPDRTKVVKIVDGDTVLISNGLNVRMVGINAPDRGNDGYDASILYLSTLINTKNVLLEYDAYQDDKYGRILAYIWTDCMEQLVKYCRPEHSNQMLVNEIIVKENYADHVIYSKRRKLKYESYFSPEGRRSPKIPNKML